MVSNFGKKKGTSVTTASGKNMTFDKKKGRVYPLFAAAKKLGEKIQVTKIGEKI